MEYPKRYKDKIVLVTASATGIGLAMAKRFAREGATVIVNSRSPEHVAHAVSEIKKEGFNAVGCPANVGTKEDQEKLFKFVKDNFGRLDVLVLNAAVSLHMGATLDTKEEQFDKMFQVNVKSVFMLVKAFHPYLKATKDSNIMIITSYAGYDLSTTIGIYSVTKTALIGLIKLLAKELYDDKIRVNGIAPGLIKTKLSAPLWKNQEDSVKDAMQVSRLGEPEDIANAAAYLCSKEADYVTGEILLITGKSFPRL